MTLVPELMKWRYRNQRRHSPAGSCDLRAASFLCTFGTSFHRCPTSPRVQQCVHGFFFSPRVRGVQPPRGRRLRSVHLEVRVRERTGESGPSPMLVPTVSGCFCRDSTRPAGCVLPCRGPCSVRSSMRERNRIRTTPTTSRASTDHSTTGTSGTGRSLPFRRTLPGRGSGSASPV